jgi:hypothetical protein
MLFTEMICGAVSWDMKRNKGTMMARGTLLTLSMEDH